MTAMLGWREREGLVAGCGNVNSSSSSTMESTWRRDGRLVEDIESLSDLNDKGAGRLRISFSCLYTYLQIYFFPLTKQREQGLTSIVFRRSGVSDTFIVDEDRTRSSNSCRALSYHVHKLLVDRTSPTELVANLSS